MTQPSRGRAPLHVLRGVIDDAHLADLELRNRERARELIRELGPKYVCHAANAPQRRNPQRASA